MDVPVSGHQVEDACGRVTAWSWVLVGSDSPVISAQGLARSYGTHARVHALRDATFDVFAGEFVTVQGPSGSGKSTLLNLLGLLEKPTAGTYLLDGLDTSTMGEKQLSWLRGTSLGFVFQTFQLLNERPAVDNVAMGLLYRGANARSSRSLASAALERVGMGGKLGQAPRTMSGGERQRVAIARAIVGQPAVLLCDEPTGSLDSENGAAVMSLFSELNSSGVTILLITHDEVVARRGTRRLWLSDGCLALRRSMSESP